MTIGTDIINIIVVLDIIVGVERTVKCFTCVLVLDVCVCSSHQEHAQR